MSRRKVSFRRPERDGFRLDTGDVEDRRLFGRWFGSSVRTHQRGATWSRFLSAGGTRTSREIDNIETDADLLSQERFWLALGALVLIWILGEWA